MTKLTTCVIIYLGGEEVNEEMVLINKYNRQQITLESFVDILCNISRYYCSSCVEYYGEEGEETYEEFIDRLKFEEL